MTKKQTNDNKDLHPFVSSFLYFIMFESRSKFIEFLSFFFFFFLFSLSLSLSVSR